MLNQNLSSVILSVLFILNLKQFSTDAASSTGVSVTVTWDNNAASTNFVMSKTVTSNRNYFAFALSSVDNTRQVRIAHEGAARKRARQDNYSCKQKISDKEYYKDSMRSCHDATPYKNDLA